MTNDSMIKMKNKQKESSFKPSMKILLRIMKKLNEKGSSGKTNLSLETNLNYSRLATHIAWLEKKGLIKSAIEDGKINVDLTRNGRVFAMTCSS